MLFIGTKHNVQIWGVIPSNQATETFKQQLNGEKQWKMRRKAKPLTCFGLNYVVFVSSAWKTVGMTILFCQGLLQQTVSR